MPGASVPYTFDFDRKHRLLRCRMQGWISDKELVGFNRAGQKPAPRVQLAAGVIDTTGVTSFDLAPQTIRGLANFAPVIPDPKVPRVISARSSDVFGMARMFELTGADTAWAILGAQNSLFETLEVE